MTGPYCITKAHPDTLRSVVTGTKRFATVAEAYAQLVKMERSGRYKYPLLIDFASKYDSKRKR